jgi:hypothetical protein
MPDCDEFFSVHLLLSDMITKLKLQLNVMQYLGANFNSDRVMTARLQIPTGKN